MATKKKPTPKQLAARKLFAERAKAGTLRKGAAKKRKKNPTAKSVSRPSRATGKKPSKRLVSRRVRNTKKGYFPNPTQPTSPRYVVSAEEKGKFVPLCYFPRTKKGKKDAFEYARAVHKKTGHSVAVD